jgi:membrane protein
MSEDLSIFRKTLAKWRGDNAAGFAASLAYYTLFSIVPLTVILTSAIGSIFGDNWISGEAYKVIAENMGSEVAGFLNSVFLEAMRSHTFTTNILTVILALTGAIGAFAQMKLSLNRMWRSSHEKRVSFLRSILPGTAMFILLAAVGSLLLLSAIFSASIAGVYAHANLENTNARVGIMLADILGSMFLTAFLVYCIFRFLPNTRLPRHDLFFGALFTSLLFTLGKIALNIYFQFSHTISIFGTARAVIILLLWVYYSAQIFYFGAEFTYIYSEERRGPSLL